MSQAFLFGLIGILVSLASIAGIVVAIIQTRNLNKVQERKNKGTWMALSGISTLMETLHSSPYDEHPDSERSRLRSTITSQVLNIYRSLLMEATIDEKDFSAKTVETWVIGGKIDHWEIKEAIKYVPTDKMNIPVGAIFELADETMRRR